MSAVIAVLAAPFVKYLLAAVIAGTVWATCNERATSAREWRGGGRRG